MFSFKLLVILLTSNFALNVSQDVKNDESLVENPLQQDESHGVKSGKLFDNFKKPGGLFLPLPSQSDVDKFKSLVGDVSNAAKEKLLQLAGHHQHHENHNQEFIEGSSNLKSQSGVKSLKVSPPKVGALHFKGGCNEKPLTPANANLKCSLNSGCEAQCLDEFLFPGKSKKLQIRCEDNVWKASGFDQVPDCEPICMPPCENLGFCMAPNFCNCPDNYEGPQCQFPKSKPCLDKPPTPMNSRVVCNEKECIATCNKGFAFLGGGKKLTLTCEEGSWTQASSTAVKQQQGGGFQRIPDCQPVCDPVCMNGGRCLPNNHCECPQNFRGPQCNYPVENCNPERFKFNGGYNCSGASVSFSCMLNCGATGVFEFPPAPVYTCEYAKAAFTPQLVPQCIFESSQVEYYSSNSSSQSEMLIGQSSQLEWNQKIGIKSKKEYEKYFAQFFAGGREGEYSITEYEYSLIRESAPKPGTCLAWGGVHYKTFDGKVYSFQSDCSHVLVRDAVASTFSIVYGNGRKKSITVFVEDFTYEIDTDDKGQPQFRKGGNAPIAIPNVIDGMITERVSNSIVLRADGLGFTLKWDTKSAISVDVNEALWNRTAGLCGRINGFWVDDFENRDGTRSSSLLGFANSWEANENCQFTSNEKHSCKWDTKSDQAVSNEATAICERLLKDPRFEPCRKIVDVQSFYETCRWDYCQCAKEKHGGNCECPNSLETYFHECLRRGVEIPGGWRDPTFCPMNCNDGRVYTTCGPVDDETCSSPVDESTTPTDMCMEGCFCPKESALHEGKCIPRSQCPCTLHQKTYKSGEQVPNDCNTCTCVAGKWTCTEVRCGARCAVVGDPHYTTFDGFHYDFMGKCSYVLMKGSNYSIEAENVPCSGAISQAMNFPAKSLHNFPSCTKSVTIRVEKDVIKLKQNREVFINGEEMILNPSVWIDALYIRHASSNFLAVTLPNGLEIWWDGQTRVYIDAPATFYGTKTKGLCGTYNENQRDDLTTQEGDIEQSVMAFANAWKTSETCQDASLDEPQHPCEVNGHNRTKAEKRCAKIKEAIFQNCHQQVDPESFYKDCVYDVCACQSVKLGECLCPAIASYAKACSHKGVIVDWIPEVRECGVNCHGGQIYQVCGNSCGRSCYDIAMYPNCRKKCIEGCNCPEGQALDPYGQCVQIHQCPCLHKGVEYQPGQKEIRPGARNPEFCTCINARWSCNPATLEEQSKYANKSSSLLQCRASHNEEFTNCEPVAQLTCKNMKEVSIKKPTECHPGCKCKAGYVLESYGSKNCIKPTECPCHHGGRSYSENNRIIQDCNTCTCRSGKWECTNKQCPGLCTNWGESHYKTFDGKSYDFHGNCDYMLVKGSSTEPNEKFQISIQSVPCGTGGVACSRLIHLRLGSTATEEEKTLLTLARHKKIPSGKFSDRIFVREAGLFVFVEIADLGLILQWDHGTRLYVRLDPKWKGRVRGLCGNFNDNQLDDFQPPSGGLTEVEAKVFGDSWRIQKYCPESPDYIDTCTLHPHRKVWSVMKCSLLKSALFEDCHAEVPVEHFVEKCILDSCGCDMGGDCECLCTSFAAYAHECNLKGIPIKWRSQELCPLQCDEECSSYSPCMSTCPAVTCDNPFGASPLCGSDTCVEGCQPQKCPRGQVHRSSKEMSCISVSECRSALCMVVDGIMYAEGEIMEKDLCHACYCSKGKRVCQGQPCAETIFTTTSRPASSATSIPLISTTKDTPSMKIDTCRTGWSEWINTHSPKLGGDTFDREPIPNQLKPGLSNSPICASQQMVAIECRTVESQISHKKTGDNVDCNLKSGLECSPGGIKGRNACIDYEIRVLCDCNSGGSTTSKPMPVTVGKTTTFSPNILIGDKCDPTRPHIPHPTSCYLFYHCVDRLNGVEHVEKTCQPPTMFNPITMVCDWAESVLRIRPECGSSKPSPTTSKPMPVTVGRTTTFSPSNLIVGDKCDPARPHIPHPTSCYLFYHCVDRLNGIEHVEKTCQPPTMFNPITMVCDWAESVLRIRPECGSHATTATPTKRPTTSFSKPPSENLVVITEEEDYEYTDLNTNCPSGSTWKPCVHRCNQMCLAFSYMVKKRGYCKSPERCLPRCVEDGKPKPVCPPGSFWRDEKTCVARHDCNCVTPQGSVVAPGSIIHPDGENCEVCQCNDNEYICDNSKCSYRWTTSSLSEMKNVSVFTTPKPRPSGPSASTVSCSAWSEWFNDDRIPADGDREFKTVEELHQMGFCLHGRITDIDCRTTKDDKPWTKSHDKKLVCSVENGLTCLETQQGKTGRCNDYKIRYFCVCSDGTRPATATTTIMIWPTATPSSKPTGKCPEKHLTALFSDHQRIPDSAFSATSSTNAQLGPSSARLTDSSFSWVAAKRDLDQHLQVDLGAPTRLEGFEITGNPVEKEYVTSLFVLYSFDNQRFSYINGKSGKPELFRGPLEHNGRKINLFEHSVEARYIRFEPQTWKHAIALKFDLFTCEIIVTTPPSGLGTSTTLAPFDICRDQMGIENGQIHDQHITYSSVDGHYNDVRLGSEKAWKPRINSRKEFVRVDLLEPRNLSGIVTQGLANGEAWVESYIVQYSTDGVNWITIFNDDGSQLVFHGNVDENTAHPNFFKRLIRARYIKIFPWQWHETIALRMDVLGCYHPVSVTEPTIHAQTTPSPEFSHCRLCPNMPQDQLNIEHCACPPSLLWDGKQCIMPAFCPCFDGPMKYPVGAMFHNQQNCSSCVCTLGGVSDCRLNSQTCAPCEKGYVAETKAPQCQCSCRRCEPGTRPCHSTNVCLDEALWCNGVEDCPGDELNCTPVTPTDCALIVCAEGYWLENSGLVASDGCPIYNCKGREKVPGLICPEPTCPPGFIMDLIESDYDGEQQSQQQGLQSQQFQQLSDLSHLQQHANELQSQQSSQNQQNTEVCPSYKCITDPSLIMSKNISEIREKESKCSITSRMFRTFDGTNYSYDICHHTLVRDKKQELWAISVHKNCDMDGVNCSRSLRIKHRNQTLEFLSGLRVLHNGYEYSANQAEQIAFNAHQGFTIRKIADQNLLLKSEEFDFWAVYDTNTNIKIGVSSTLSDRIDGLCGFYNFHAEDDMLTPAGKIALSSQEFGDSWSVKSHSTSECAITQCPISTQTVAWKKCSSLIRHQPFKHCHDSEEAIDRAIFRCVEVICDCIQNLPLLETPSATAGADQCQCKVMGVMANECYEKNPSVDLSGWRSKHDCVVECSGGAVYHECNKPTCETTCLNKKNYNTCPEVPNLCFPGCVCPDGLVRRSDNQCVKPSECRDCVCDGFGHSQYITFDHQNFTFTGNCSYIAARDLILPQESKIGHDFQVLVTNKPCEYEPTMTCTEELTILHQDHVINLRRSGKTRTVIASLDGELIDNFPLHLHWMRIEKLPEEISLLLLSNQVEVSYYFYNYGFKVRAPSQLYMNKTEGLCGNCNGLLDDDMHLPNGMLADDVNQFGLSWLVSQLLKESPIGDEDQCQADQPAECQILEPENDPCFKLIDSDIFKECHAIVDPLPYLSSCQFDTCRSVDSSTSACYSMEAYARECSKYQVCLSWRSEATCPMECPFTGMEYRQCGSGCLTDCQQINEGDSFSTCIMSVVDGCYCPDGQALNEVLNRCVPFDQCKPCDSEGHFKGDEWKRNSCTSCSCNEQGNVECHTKECVMEQCFLGQVRTIIPPSEGECCPSVVCSFTETNNSCPNIITPNCGRDQVLQFQNINGCMRQVCECIPPSDCPPMDPMDSPVVSPSIGERHVVNNSGCCPFWERICDVQACPSKPDCQPYYRPEIAYSSDNACCTVYECVPQKDVCIYEHQHVPLTKSGTKSGRRKSSKQFKSIEKRSVELPQPSVVKVYSLNDTWKDGPCLECRCEYEFNIARSVCTTHQCPDAIDDDYVLKVEHDPEECCPRLIRTACQLQSRIFKAGEEWPAPGGDPCKTYVCQELSDGTVVKQLHVQTCTTTCPDGYEYELTNSSSDECCGRCVQVGCVYENTTHAIGSSWTPDPCTTITCSGSESSSQAHLTMSQFQCPPITDCAENNIVVKDGDCCPTCNATQSLSNCQPEALPLEKTVGYVVHHSVIHGQCSNNEPVEGLKECHGHCASKTIHETNSIDPSSQCECCQAEMTEDLPVKLVCADGKTWSQIIRIPKTCNCSPCIGGADTEQILQQSNQLRQGRGDLQSK